jgi:hypothetical protein
MELRWKDMNPKQKVLSILATLTATIALVLVCMEFAGKKLPYMDFSLLFLGITSLLQAPVAWASNRKIAYVELAAGGALVIMSILDLFI